MGVGPADVNLRPIFAGLTGYQNFLLGTTGPNNVVYEGRYGEYGATMARAGRANAGAYGPDDILDQLRRYSLPLNYNYYTGGLTNYGSPHRFVGAIDGGRGLRRSARLVISPSFSPSPPDTLGSADNQFPYDPYALNLSRASGLGRHPARRQHWTTTRSRRQS